MTIQIKKRTAMQQVQIRLPPEIRERAKQMAQEQQADESKVYRTIIEAFFFDESDTNSKQDT